jgi:hypothetical protein
MAKPQNKIEAKTAIMIAFTCLLLTIALLKGIIAFRSNSK